MKYPPFFVNKSVSQAVSGKFTLSFVYFSSLSGTNVLRVPPHHHKLKAFFQSNVLAVLGTEELVKPTDMLSIPGSITY